MLSNNIIEAQAKQLAADHKEAEPDVERIYWFPDSEEVRLIVVTPSIPPSGDGALHPFYFRANASDNLPSPSAIALIRPEESGKLRLPPKWGDWTAGVALELELAS